MNCSFLREIDILKGDGLVPFLTPNFLEHDAIDHIVDGSVIGEEIAGSPSSKIEPQQEITEICIT
jgi:hypothetical protein